MRRSVGLIAIFALSACLPEPADSIVEPLAATEWPAPEAIPWGNVSAVDIDSHGHVFVLQRGERVWAEPFPTDPIGHDSVLMFSADGELLASFGEGELVMPHGLTVGANDDVYVTDVQREQVIRFSHDGALQDAWGERGVSGGDQQHFGRPADIAATPDTVLVADGYTNSRIAVFDAEGRFRRQWGVPGDGPNGLNLPHGLAVREGRVYVADRENRRIMVYSPEGKPQAQWPLPGHPYAIKPAPDGRIATLEGRDAEGNAMVFLRLFSQEGERLGAFKVEGFAGAKGHDFAIAGDGTLYIADVEGGRLLTARLPQH